MAVETAILPFSRELIREAVEFERDRQGQIYFVFNRVEGIEQFVRDLPLISLPVAPASAVWRAAEFGGRMQVHGRWYVYSLALSAGYFISLAAPEQATVKMMDARGLLDAYGL